ncbi:MAG TPA: phosphatidylglycerophosphatase A, partial [Gammaproteobacteria bacterium]|nr:phosphatidylglycerophosphatase A [Gammaproteobacteria bacterium]
SLPLYLALVVVSLVFGVWVCGKAGADLGVHDHGGIVWDEFVGLWITLIAVPAGWEWIVAGFLLFRLFDIWKPWPIGWADRQVSGGLGVMLDDVIAGLYAWLILQLGVVLL